MSREIKAPPRVRFSVLVVDQDVATREALATALAGAGHAVRAATDGRSALRAIELWRPQLVLLDVDLPDVDGLDVLRTVRRRHPRMPGVIVVSGRAREHERLAGFAAGADDYVVKPFSTGEVVARAAGILRRLERHAPAQPALLRAGQLVLDPVAQRVTYRGAAIDLSRIQFRLLADLIAEPGQLRTYAQLVAAVWGGEDLAARQTVIVHVQRLRKRLAMVGCSGVAIESMRGIGYRLTTDVEPGAGVGSTGRITPLSALSG